MGDFHAMQELFTIIGKIIKGSGFEDIMYQVGICTTDGIKAVTSGKHYNRSWAVHECLSEAMHRLFIEQVAMQLTLYSSLRHQLKIHATQKIVECLFKTKNSLLSRKVRQSATRIPEWC